jgi:hypothetical protein
MALRACRECGSQISTKAETCPHCGIAAPARTVLDGIKDGIKEIILGLVSLCVVLGVFVFIVSSREAAKNDEEAKQKCLEKHPLTEKQTAARKHFGTCWQYSHTPSSVWSDNQRTMMLIGEGCYSDDRDDLRYGDAAWDVCKSR